MSETNLPTVSFSADKTVIVEDGEAQLITFNLSEPALPEGLVVDLQIDDPDGESGPGDTEFPPELISNIVDFGQVEEDGTITVSLTIAEGTTEATFGIAAFEDEVETKEIYSLTLLEGENYIADPNSTTITTTIENNMTSPIVSITPETLIATEGKTFAWNFSLDAPAPEGGLSLFLPITVNNDPAPGDVEYNIDGSNGISEFEFVTENDVSIGFNLTIAEGETEAVLVSEAVADDITETDEIFTTVIADGVDYQANPEQNEVTTVITELPVVSLVTEEVTTAEGDTFAWEFSLNQPAPEGGLTLFLPVTANNDPAPGDVEYNIDGSSGIADFEFVVEDDVSIGFNVTIAEGATEASLVSEVIADDVEEETEVFTTVIADGENYRANPVQNEVTTTLSDADISNNLPTVSLIAEPSQVNEGEQLEFNLNLTEPVGEGGLVVNLDLLEDTDPLPGDISYFVEGSKNITDFELIVDEESGLIDGATIILAEGATSATLLNDIIADNATEGEESVTFGLVESDEYSIDSEVNAASFTILDTSTDTSTDVPTVSISPETVTATEGETFAWNFSLDQPAPEGGLSLFLPITVNNDPAPGDVEYNVEGSNNIAEFEFVTNGDESISQIYAFGDSYSDDGLSFEISTDAVEAGVPDSFILPADPELGLYDPEGRWTNGPTAVEVLSENLEVDLTNYAVGGAKSGDGNYYSWLDSFHNTGLSGQVEQFSIDLEGQPADLDALYFIFASANDFFEFSDFGLPGTVEELATQTVDNIKQEISDLSALGAEQFFIVNSSDLGILPGTIEFEQAEDAALFTEEVNELLPQELEALEEELEVDIVLYDHEAISDEIRANPQEFDLTNVDDPAQPVFPVEPPSDNPDEYYFWDEYHPTARVHQIIGEDMVNFVDFEDEGEVSTGFNITIAEDETEATLVSEVVADGIEEGEESFTTVLTEGEDYDINPEQNQIVTNLIDSDTSGNRPTTIFGTTEADIIEVDGVDRLVFAGDSDDLIDASVASGGRNRIYGGNGDDTVVLGEGDRVIGNEGNDRIFATSGGSNIITGGAGADQFWIASAEIPESANTITDFTLGEDVIGIAGLGINFNDLIITQTNAGASISLDSSNLTLVNNVAADSLNSDNFAFA